MKPLILAVVLIATGCGVRLYGNLKCEGPCELTIDREVKELDSIPFDPVPSLRKEK